MNCTDCEVQNPKDNESCASGGSCREIPAQSAQLGCQKSAVPGRGFAVASRILGVFGTVTYILFLCFLVGFARWYFWLLAFGVVGSGSMFAFCFMFFLPIVLSVLAIVFSRVAHRRGYVGEISKTGLITGIVNLSLYAFFLIFILVLALV